MTFLRRPILKNICKRLVLKLVLSPALPFLITYSAGSNWHISFSFCMFANSRFTTVDTAIIRSNQPMIIWKRAVLTNFAKFTSTHLCLRLFFDKVISRTPTILLKRLRHRCFPLSFAKEQFFSKHLQMTVSVHY